VSQRIESIMMFTRVTGIIVRRSLVKSSRGMEFGRISGHVRYLSDKGNNGKEFLLYSVASEKPNPTKENSLGEDSYYIATTNRSIGVADGVGGWSEHGIDSGAFSRELMAGCKHAAQQEGSNVPVEILRQGFSNVQSQGSSTACVVCIEGNVLRVANLGDSGFYLLRKTEPVHDSGDRRSVAQLEWTVVAATVEQLHSFNCPVQLGTSSSDTADSADLSAVEVEPGDITICCTDGLLDNVWEDEIVRLCADAFKEIDSLAEEDVTADLKAKSVKALSNTLMETAFEFSESKVRRSPFEANAKRWGYRYRGGKMDDITCVCAWVVKEPPGQSDGN